MKYLALITILLTNSIALALENQNQCAQFNNIALQLSLAHNNMPPPIDLEQLQNILGRKNPESFVITTTYSWTYKNRVLLVKANNDNLTTKLLTGNDDGSSSSRKMEQIYEKLKAETSIWFIKNIQQQLGPGYITSTKAQKYTWYCGIGSLEVTATPNNTITTATISYKTSQNQDTIEAQIGPNHPDWNTKIDAINQYYRAWQRSYQ